MPRYIDANKIKITAQMATEDGDTLVSLADVRRAIEQTPTADVVEVIRCKDCKHFIPEHIRLDNGTTRAYTEQEKNLPFGVMGDVGINCGSRCMRYQHWEENRVPVWVQEDDFCSYGKRREQK